jgi:phosphonate transport system substrate-binding protein
LKFGWQRSLWPVISFATGTEVEFMRDIQNEEGSSSSSSSSRRSASVGGRWLARAVLWLALAVTLVVAGLEWRRLPSAQAQRDSSSVDLVRSSGLMLEPATKHLATMFSDSGSRLLADAPADASKQIDPPSIVLAHLVASDAENPSIPWQELESALATATGKKVIDQPYDNSPEQMAHIKSGEMTLVALHAADAPFLVNNYGYQPIAVLGDEAGAANGNHLDFIVPASSPIAKLADLRGHTLLCTVPSSITGYRAAVAVLMHSERLRPNVDYLIAWSLNQRESIEGVTSGKYEAAAVSDDKLQSMLAKGQVSASSYKMIWQSPVIPRTTIGWFYNLQPQLASKLRGAILAFRPGPAAAAVNVTSAADGGDSTDVAADGPPAPSKPLHFVPIDYKKDFELVRIVDDQFDPRFQRPPKTGPRAGAATSPSSSRATP